MRKLFVALLLFAAAAPGFAQCVTKTVTCGSSSTDFIGPSGSCILDGFPTQRYVFNGTAGQKVTFIASNTAGETIGMNLTNSAGQFISSDFDEPAQITATLPAAGQYFIEVNFGNPNVSGSIKLEVSCTTTPAQCSYTATLPIGQSVTSQLTSADTPCGTSRTYAKAYRVPVTAGDAFTIDYTASYPVAIDVAGPDTSGSYRTATGTTLTTAYVAPTTGNVTIFVESNGTTPQTGTFTLTLTPLTLPSCGRVRAVRH